MTAPQPVLQTQRLTKSYGSAVVALADLDLVVEPGITGIVGVNGAGKSTLLKIILGLLAPTSGTVQVLGRDPVAQGEEVRALVGYMPEHDCLPADITAADFVQHMAAMSGLPRQASRERGADVLRHVGLDEERHRVMGGYSTGMKQRAKLAQAIVHDPAVVFLDEPTNGLDPRSRDDMLDLISRIHADFGISVVVTSHLLSELERTADRIVMIDGGRLVRSSSTAELTRGTGTALVEVLGGPGADRALGQALVDRGLTAWPSGHQIEVDLRDPSTLDVIRDVAAELGVGLVRLHERHHTLEEVFVTGAPPPPTEGARR